MNAYPGAGRILYLSYDPAGWPAGNAEVVVQPPDPVIPNASYSDSEAVSDAQSVTIRVEYNAAPGAVTTIQCGSNPRLSDAFTLDTIPLSATDTVAFWTTQEQLNGFIRVKNTSTAQINKVTVQKQVRA